MVWYYAENSRQHGPLSESEFERMIADGQIRDNTLVWKDGMEDWRPLSDVKEAGASQHPTATANVAERPLESPAPTGVVCSNCERTVPSEQIDRYGNIRICPECKPHFLGTVTGKTSGFPATGAEAGAPAGAVPATAGALYQYGGFWIRALARVIDSLIRGIALLPFTLPVMAPVFQQVFVNPAGQEEMQELMQTAATRLLPLMITVEVIYHALFVAIFSATPGKMLCGLRVISADGSKVGASKAISRAIIPALLVVFDALAGLSIGAFILVFGYVMAAFDAQKRTLFDHLVGTRVVQKL